jgi:hypothetical protein
MSQIRGHPDSSVNRVPDAKELERLRRGINLDRTTATGLEKEIGTVKAGLEAVQVDILAYEQQLVALVSERAFMLDRLSALQDHLQRTTYRIAAQRAVSHPVRRTPTEVLIAIFNLAITAERKDLLDALYRGKAPPNRNICNADYPFSHTIFAIAAVCQHWRTVAQSRGQLWRNNILASSTDEDRASEEHRFRTALDINPSGGVDITFSPDHYPNYHVVRDQLLSGRCWGAINCMFSGRLNLLHPIRTMHSIEVLRLFIFDAQPSGPINPSVWPVFAHLKRLEYTGDWPNFQSGCQDIEDIKLTITHGSVTQDALYWLLRVMPTVRTIALRFRGASVLSQNRSTFLGVHECMNLTSLEVEETTLPFMQYHLRGLIRCPSVTTLTLSSVNMGFPDDQWSSFLGASQRQEFIDELTIRECAGCAQSTMLHILRPFVSLSHLRVDRVSALLVLQTLRAQATSNSELLILPKLSKLGIPAESFCDGAAQAMVSTRNERLRRSTTIMSQDQRAPESTINLYIFY